jgi:hypothetical protein
MSYGWWYGTRRIGCCCFPTHEVASPELGSGGRSSGGKAAGPGPDIDESRRFDYEKEDYLDFR